MSDYHETARGLHKLISGRSCAQGGDCTDALARCYCLDEIKIIEAVLVAAVEDERAACEVITDEEIERPARRDGMLDAGLRIKARIAARKATR